MAVVWLWSGADDSPWIKTTTPATVTCESDDCVELLPVDAGHGGHDALRLGYDPTIDDAVAQWAQCIGGVLICRGETGNTRDCVSASACPETCRSGFADAAANLTAEPELGQLFLKYFVEEGGACVPPAEDAQ